MLERCKYTIILVVIFICCSEVCHAAMIDKIYFPDFYEINSQKLSLRGGGYKRYYGFKIWTSCLYVDKTLSNNDILKDYPKRIEVHYLLEIPGAEIGRATDVGITNNVSPEKYKELEPRIQKANSFFPNVKKGDKYLVTYIPGEGTSFVFNGKKQGVIEGTDFAFAFFSVWIGENPIDRKLKKKMLGLIK